MSKPRNSSDFQQQESLIVQDSNSTPPQTSTTIELESPTLTENNFHLTTSTSDISSNKEGQSTAILISAGANNQEDNNKAGICSLSREKQENELRRIALERKIRGELYKNNNITLIKNNNTTPVKQSNNNNNNNQSLELQIKQQNVVQQDNSQLPVSTPQQLAIYINGKIRSNSIFCRSTSSNSFNSILNRFHSSSSNNNNNNSNSSSNNKKEEKLQALGGNNNNKENYIDINDKESTIRLCLNSKEKSSAQQEKSSRKSCINKRHINNKNNSIGYRFINGFSSNAQKLIANYLPNTINKSKPSFASNRLSRSSSSSSLAPPTTRADNNSKVFKGPLILKEEEEEEEQEEEGDNRSKKSLKHLESFEEEPGEGAQASKARYKLNPSSMLLRKAMRYYRIWIYGTNISILIGTLIFILATINVLSDYRIKLLTYKYSQYDNNTSISDRKTLSSQETESNDIFAAAVASGDKKQQLTTSFDSFSNESIKIIKKSTINKVDSDIYISYTEPYVILGYVAIAIQAGILQAIGCFGAIQMKQRWIQTFLYLILTLTLFDFIFSFYWLYRYSFIANNLKRHMSFRLKQHYGQLGIISPSSNLDLNFYQQQSSHLINGDSIQYSSTFDKITTVSISLLTKRIFFLSFLITN